MESLAVCILWYIPRNLLTVHTLFCFSTNKFYQYISGKLHWIARNYTINQTKQCTTKVCTHLMGYIVLWTLYMVIGQLSSSQIFMLRNQFVKCVYIFAAQYKQVLFNLQIITWISNVSKININSLWPSNAIRRRIRWSTLVQVIVCCLTSPSWYLNECCFIIKWILGNKPQLNWIYSFSATWMVKQTTVN